MSGGNFGMDSGDNFRNYKKKKNAPRDILQPIYLKVAYDSNVLYNPGVDTSNDDVRFKGERWSNIQTNIN